MEDLTAVCQRFHTVLPIPLTLVTSAGEQVQTWPETYRNMVVPSYNSYLLDDFKKYRCDARHPLVSYVPQGYFVGVTQAGSDSFLIVGLVSPFHHSEKELIEFIGPAIVPNYLQHAVSLLTAAPIVSLSQFKSYMSLLAESLTHESVTEDDLIYLDRSGRDLYGNEKLAGARFQQRETPDPHAATNYENGVCDAVSLGRTDLLIQRLSASPGGSIGMMSPNPLRQQQYSLISFATLLSRAAIRGGLSDETAFLLSDLYCQRIDSLTRISDLEKLAVGMAMDFCEQVARNHMPKDVSQVVRKALNYISIHLHEPFGMEALSEHCHLCRRSLTIRFQKEMGMTVSEYVQKEKTQEAKFLLHHTSTSLSEIATYLNYSSQSYFTQQFKKSTGETPEQYRKRIAG